MTTNGLEQFSADEIIDELVRRGAPDETVRLINERLLHPVSSIEELRRRVRLGGPIGGLCRAALDKLETLSDPREIVGL
jgi:hypothetical protein